MDGISLSWFLRIQELEAVLIAKQEELQTERKNLDTAQAFLGQSLDEQKKLRQQSLAIQQQKAELQCVVLELETKVCSNDIGVISEETLDVVCDQERFEHLFNRKHRVAAKMKREQNDIQDFSRLMKSVLQEKTDSITTLQDKLVEQKKQTEQMKCELALFQESIADTQQEQDSLQNALAQKEECLEHKKQDNSELQSVISRLSLDKQQQEKHAQEQLDCSKSLLNQFLADQRHIELRLRQEQAAGRSLVNRQPELQFQMEKLKKAVLAISE